MLSGEEKGGERSDERGERRKDKGKIREEIERGDRREEYKSINGPSYTRETSTSHTRF